MQIIQIWYKIFVVGILLVMIILASGCKDEKISQDSISTSEATLNTQANDLDKKSYAGLEDVFQDTSTLESKNKYMMFVFGANGCQYCERLKEDIKNNQELKDYIKDHFSAYYINLSYSKLHTFKIPIQKKEYELTTRQLAEIYNILPTPTIVFSNADGKTILSYPSYLPPQQFFALLRFISEGEWQKAQGDEAKLKSLLQKYLTPQS